MKLRCLVATLAFLAVFASDSRGQSKQPSPKANQQNATQPERGTENSPVVVKILPTEKPKDELDSEKAKQESDRLLVSLTGDLAKYTNRLFWATGFLGLITGGLVFFGFIQVRDSKRSIRAAETSAKIAERALTELEAPFLAINIKNTGIEWHTTQPILFGDLIFTIANYGRTPAHILELVEGVLPVKIGGGQPPVLDSSKVRGNPMPYGVIAPPNDETQEFKTIPNIYFYEGSEPGIFAKEVTQKAFFRGFVRYRDIFGGHYVLGFCFIFDPDGDRWVLLGNEDHNYCRKEDGPKAPHGLQPTADFHSIRSAVNRAILNQREG
jgi:hypothetical protein